MVLKHLLANLAFEELFQSVFDGQLASRSEELVEDTKDYMQRILKTNLVRPSTTSSPCEGPQDQPRGGIRGVEGSHGQGSCWERRGCRARLGVHSDRSYIETLQAVHIVVADVRENRYTTAVLPDGCRAVKARR